MGRRPVYTSVRSAGLAQFGLAAPSPSGRHGHAGRARDVGPRFWRANRGLRNTRRPRRPPAFDPRTPDGRGRARFASGRAHDAIYRPPRRPRPSIAENAGRAEDPRPTSNGRRRPVRSYRRNRFRVLVLQTEGLEPKRKELVPQIRNPQNIWNRDRKLKVNENRTSEITFNASFWALTTKINRCLESSFSQSLVPKKLKIWKIL